MKPLKLALLMTDARENYREYTRPEPYFGTAPEALLQGFARLPEVEVHVVSCTQHPVGAPAKLADNIWFHSLLVPKFGWLRTGYQGCIRATRRKLKELQPDIVHGQGTERDCALSAVLSAFPNVVTIHGNMHELARRFRATPFTYAWWAARIEGPTLRRAGGVFCNSAYTESLVAPRARRVWRVANPIRGEFFGTPTVARTARPVLLNVGMLMPRKRQLELLRAARRLHGQGVDFELCFVGGMGDDDYARAFQEELKRAEALGYARHLGTMNTGQLIELFDAARALVHFPSEEAFGLVVAEALARGLKLFGSQLGGIADIAGGLPGSELFSPEDFDGLIESVAKWIKAGAAVAPEAAQAMRERYHPEVIARRHLEIYREVLSTRS